MDVTQTVATPSTAHLPKSSGPPDQVPAIELVGIAKRFHSRRGEVTAVERVDLVDR